MKQRQQLPTLMPELCGRILSHMEDRERCQVIPVLSKEWQRIHEEFPPRRKELRISSPASQPIVRWFLKVAPTLERLHIYMHAEPFIPNCLIPQILALAAVVAPRLAELRISSWATPEVALPSLGLLSQIKRLTIDSLSDMSPLRTRDYPSEWGFLTGLRSLEAIKLEFIDFTGSTASEAEDFWGAVARLRNLGEVDVMVPQGSSVHPSNLNFFDPLWRLKQISALRLWNADDGMEENLYPERFSQLTQLTSVRLETDDSVAAFGPIYGLPHLQDVQITINQGQLMPNLMLQSRQLTRLSFQGGYANSAEEMISPATPALLRLRKLRLHSYGLNTIPSSFAAVFKQLESLDLSDSQFKRIPAALGQITSLTELDMSSNNGLELVEKEDLSTLEAIGLISLCLVKRVYGQETDRNHGYSEASIATLDAIDKQFPGLLVPELSI